MAVPCWWEDSANPSTGRQFIDHGQQSGKQTFRKFPKHGENPVQWDRKIGKDQAFAPILSKHTLETFYV
jgi:hypothetical protein